MTDDDWRKILSIKCSRNLLSFHADGIRKHLVDGGHNLRVGLIGALDCDHFHELGGNIHIRLFQGVGGNTAKTRVSGIIGDGRTALPGFFIKVAADLIKSLAILEARQCHLKEGY